MKKISLKITQRTAKLSFILFVLLSGIQPAQATTHYVTLGGAGSKNGSSWSNAWDSIAFRNNISGVAHGDTVWVATGIYHPNLSNSGNSYTIPSGVKVYGGFAGAETALSQRNIHANRTVLDGAGIINIIVRFNYVDGTTVLDGFTVSNAYNNNGENSQGLIATYNGGGIFNNAVGGTSNPVIANDSFVNNYADGGGAIFNSAYSYGNASPTIINCAFVNNTAMFAGALFNEAEAGGVCNPTITNCIFTGNTGTTACAAVYNNNYGGNTCSPAFTNCTFVNNNAYEMTVDLEATPVFTNCIIWDNVSVEIFDLFGGYSATVNYSDIEGGWGGTGNTSAYPGFVNPAAGNFQIVSCGPAFNTATATGAPATDILGNPRPALGGYDMGAYELQTLTPIDTATFITGSIHSNGTNDTLKVSFTGSGPWVFTYSDGTNTYGPYTVNASPYSIVVAPRVTTVYSGLTFTSNVCNPASTPSTDTVYVTLPTHYYVTPGGAGNRSGDSWANAWDSIAFRNDVSTAVYGDMIWIAAGVYHPDLSNSNNYLNILSGVKVYGGFAGTETALNQRNPHLNRTVLDGAGSIYNIVYFNHVDSTTVLDGFTISNGNNNNGGINGAYSGAGIFNDGSSFGNSNPVITNDSFINNTASSYGVAIYNDGENGGNSSPVITNCIFINNTSLSGAGGAICNDGSSGNSNPVIAHCIFMANSTPYYGGGAIYNNGESGNAGATISQCTFTHNTAMYGSGGAIFNDAIFGNSTSNITDCIFNNNSANEGGAIYNQAYSGSITGHIITNCVFINDTAITSGAAIYTEGQYGICSPVATNCTFAYNISADSTIIYEDGPTDTLVNCILWDNSIGEIAENNGAVTTVNNSDVKGGWTGAGTNNISTNPQFVNVANLNLTNVSPCINTGSNAAIHGITTDLAGVARIQQHIVDMGAYESPYTTPCPTIITPSPAITEVCSGSSIVYSATASSGNPVYQWQYTTSAPTTANAQWVNFGIDTTAATLTGVAQLTYVRVVLTTPGCPTVASPSAIANVSASLIIVTASAVTTNSAVLNWNAITGASYTIVVNGNSYTSNTNTYTLTGLTACTAYSVSVTANNSTCIGTPQGNISFTTPPAMLTLSLSAGTGTAIVANWTAGVGPYKLYYGQQAGPQNLTVVNVKPGITTYTIPAKIVTAGAAYIAYIVDAGSTCSPLPQSPYAYYSTPGGSCTGTAPVITSATSSVNSITFNWTGTANTYQVYYKSPGGNWSSYTKTSTTCTITGLTAGTCYPFFVVNKCGSAFGWSSAIDTMCTSTLCAAPLNLELSEATCKGFTATWNTVAGASSYQVYCASSSGGGTPWLVSYAKTATSSTFAIFAKGATITVYVQSNCTNGGRSTSSNIQTITTLNTGCKDDNGNTALTGTSINTNSFSVYPNPNTGMFKVLMNTQATNATATLDVMDVLGRTIYTTDVTNNNGTINENIDLGNTASSGIYMVRVRCGNDTHIAKVEIQK